MRLKSESENDVDNQSMNYIREARNSISPHLSIPVDSDGVELSGDDFIAAEDYEMLASDRKNESSKKSEEASDRLEQVIVSNSYRNGITRNITQENAFKDPINIDFGSDSHEVTSNGFISNVINNRRKTVLAFFLFFSSLFVNSLSIAMTHQKVPDRNFHPPLPDLFLDNVTKHKWLNDFADVLVIISIFSCFLLVLLHDYRWLISRRAFLILSVLYFTRSVTMYLTILPLANTHVVCGPKINSNSTLETFGILITEAIQTVTAGGLNISGKKRMCGDYIYSGHTIIFCITFLLVNEYTDKKIFHWTSYISAWIGMVALIVSHGHYSIDVFLGYYFTTRVFWSYHTLVSQHTIKNKRKMERSYFVNVWWYRFFRFFEGRRRPVDGRLSNSFSLPWKNTNNNNLISKMRVFAY